MVRITWDDGYSITTNLSHSAKCLLFYMGPEYGQGFMSLSEYKKAIVGY